MEIRSDDRSNYFRVTTDKTFLDRAVDEDFRAAIDNRSSNQRDQNQQQEEKELKIIKIRFSSLSKSIDRVFYTKRRVKRCPKTEENHLASRQDRIDCNHRERRS